MALITRFHPPGNLTDFDGALAQSWSNFISDGLDGEIDALRRPGLQPQFYNPSRLDVSGTAVPIRWPAFPRIIEVAYPDDARRMFQEAERRDNQDEYLEWAAIRQDGKITKLMFTSESPEYWSFIAANDPDLLVRLYSNIAGQQVPKSDLLTPGGAYRPRNPWNMRFAIHLMQINNTLGAEMNIAAQATILRRHGGNDPVTDPDELIECSAFGAKERHSDPQIGDIVNQAAREGRSVTLQDPIALYIEELPNPGDIGIRKPDGSPVGTDYWTLERGEDGHILRAVFEVPEGEPFVVGDLTVEGDPIEFGGQIVKAGLAVKLTGIVGQQGVFHNPTFPCRGGFSALVPGPQARGG